MPAGGRARARAGLKKLVFPADIYEFQSALLALTAVQSSRAGGALTAVAVPAAQYARLSLKKLCYTISGQNNARPQLFKVTTYDSII